MQGAERGARGPAWKLHLIRQLRHRDRSQHGAFQELIQSYNKLLEKSVFLKDLTEKIQTEPVISPGGHRDARIIPTVLRGAGSEAPPTLQKEISELRDYNGELAYEACELKKEAQERDEELKRQKCSISFLSVLVEDHKHQHQCLENDMVQMVGSNADLKEDYDQLLTRRLLVEGRLHDAEEEKRELEEALTKKKAMEAEQQNNFNQRWRDELWIRVVNKALRKTVSAEGDLHQKHLADSRDCSSLEMSGSQKIDKNSHRKSRSQSMIALGSSKFMGALKSLFDFRKQDYSVDDEWYHTSPVCVFCCLPKRALYSKEIHDSEIHAVKFSPNSKMVATGGADRVVKIWDVVGGQLHVQQVLHGSNGVITSIEFDPSGAQLLAASSDGSAHLWKLDSKSSDTLTGHTGKVTARQVQDVHVSSGHMQHGQDRPGMGSA
ncbi:autophagy-related protein 16-like [Rhinoderma darwinii]|uniref:autophagy-related protein 16-like n=1 Tax=Rhinoderma darwinii TaxID=43563 RepID=UPI003F667B52